jgi:hypothetical protein
MPDRDVLFPYGQVAMPGVPRDQPPSFVVARPPGLRYPNGLLSQGDFRHYNPIQRKPVAQAPTPRPRIAPCPRCSLPINLCVCKKLRG